MKTYLAPVVLALAMIGVALLAKFDIVSAEVGRLAPFLLLALFPAVWLRRDRSCALLKRTAA